MYFSEEDTRDQSTSGAFTPVALQKSALTSPLPPAGPARIGAAPARKKQLAGSRAVGTAASLFVLIVSVIRLFNGSHTTQPTTVHHPICASITASYCSIPAYSPTYAPFVADTSGTR